MKATSLLVLGAALGLGAALAFDERLTVKTYPIFTNKITRPVKLLHVSDLHGAKYGDNCSQLTRTVRNISPDAVLMTGDILDDRISNDDSVEFLKTVAEEFPCYYVCGNHEIYTGRITEIKENLSEMGITVLEGETKEVELSGQKITIGGTDDPYGFPDNKGRLWEDQLSDCSASLDGNTFAVLLTHRPELADYYGDTGFDLVLSGHAHGGQVIIPGIINGLYAPHQGFLPKLAGGKVSLKNGGSMIVSRGLSKYVRPRVFNRPEIPLITLIPSGEKE